jgi:hypothetical protein
MREEPLDAFLREGLQQLLNPPEEQEDWESVPVRLAVRCAFEDPSDCVNRVQRIG